MWARAQLPAGDCFGHIPGASRDGAETQRLEQLPLITRGAAGGCARPRCAGSAALLAPGWCLLFSLCQHPRLPNESFCWAVGLLLAFFSLMHGVSVTEEKGHIFPTPVWVS